MLKESEGRSKSELVRLQLPPVHFIHPLMVVCVRVQDVVVIHSYECWRLQLRKGKISDTQRAISAAIWQQQKSHLSSNLHQLQQQFKGNVSKGNVSKGNVSSRQWTLQRHHK